MAVREFKGPRLLPTGYYPYEHDNTKAYEQLQFVVNENGDTFLSMKPVPPGIDLPEPPANNEYWLFWNKWSPQIEEYARQVQEYEQHVQEYDQRIEDNTDDIAKLTDYLKGEKIPSYAQPQHVGDFLFNEQFGCVCKNGQLMYGFTQAGNNNGHVHIINLVTNTVQNKAIETGHANSCANDTIRQVIWLAPFKNKLFKYDYDFKSKTVVNTEFNPYGVSFDAKTNILWAYDVPQGTDTFGQTVSFYKMAPDSEEFEPAGTIQNPFHHILSNVFDQDMAVYDNIAIITDAVGFSYTVDLETFEVTGSFVIDNESLSWVYGENEGIEFDDNGNLYQARISPFGFKLNSGDVYEYSMCSVTNIIWSGTTENAAQMLFSSAFNVEINPETISAFANARSKLKSANQLMWYKGAVGTLVYNGKVTEHSIIWAPRYPDVGIQIAAEAIVNIYRITLIKGILNLYIAQGGTLNFTSEVNYPVAITAPRAAALYMNNQGTLNYVYPKFGASGFTAIPSAIRNTGTVNKQIIFNDITMAGNYLLCAGSISIKNG